MADDDGGLGATALGGLAQGRLALTAELARNTRCYFPATMNWRSGGWNPWNSCHHALTPRRGWCFGCNLLSVALVGTSALWRCAATLERALCPIGHILWVLLATCGLVHGCAAFVIVTA